MFGIEGLLLQSYLLDTNPWVNPLLLIWSDTLWFNLISILSNM